MKRNLLDVAIPAAMVGCLLALAVIVASGVVFTGIY